MHFEKLTVIDGVCNNEQVGSSDRLIDHGTSLAGTKSWTVIGNQIIVAVIFLHLKGRIADARF